MIIEDIEKWPDGDLLLEDLDRFRVNFLMPFNPNLSLIYYEVHSYYLFFKPEGSPVTEIPTFVPAAIDNKFLFDFRIYELLYHRGNYSYVAAKDSEYYNDFFEYLERRRPEICTYRDKILVPSIINRLKKYGF